MVVTFTLLDDLLNKYGCLTKYKRENLFGEIRVYIGKRTRVLATDTNTVEIILDSSEELLDDTVFYIDERVYYLSEFISCTLNCGRYIYCLKATNKQPIYPSKIKALVSIFKRNSSLTYRKCNLDFIFDIPNRMDYTDYDLETVGVTKRLDGENLQNLISHKLTIPYSPKIEIGMTVFMENSYWKNVVLDERRHRDDSRNIAYPNTQNLERSENTGNKYLNEESYKGKYFEIYSMVNVNEVNKSLILNLVELGETDNAVI